MTESWGTKSLRHQPQGPGEATTGNLFVEDSWPWHTAATDGSWSAKRAQGDRRYPDSVTTEQSTEGLLRDWTLQLGQCHQFSGILLVATEN